MSNLNKNWINLCFVVDKSGSMYPSKEDVVGGFNKTIDEHKEKNDFKITVSLFTFNGIVHEHYLGKDIKDVPKFTYNPEGWTAMNDGIGTAIDRVGKWLREKDLNGEELPGKTLVVIMTDGMENASKEYTLKQVKDKIKEQTEKYSWDFIYMGTDVTTTKDADALGITIQTFGDRDTFYKNYDIINNATNAYYCCAVNDASIEESYSALRASLDKDTEERTKNYEKKLGKKISND